MNKEEYLNMYKEDKLAEICAQLEEEKDYYHDEMNAYKSDALNAQKRADKLTSYWDSVDKLFNKLQSLPVKDFIDLYYKMDTMMKQYDFFTTTCDLEMNLSHNALLNSKFDLEPYKKVYCANVMASSEFINRPSITKINVVVPDKVVKITFGDGKIETMVCAPEDVFDLRKCCFIAIAKHLYRDEYTFEGIEHMANELMYKKKYVRIVDRALKRYYKDEEDKSREELRKAEEKLAKARQSAKRTRYKERREKRYREQITDLLADAIVKAQDKNGE